MKRVLYFFIVLMNTVSFSQTKVGNVQFNDVDVFGETELMLNGAGERARLYAAALYLDLDFNPDDLEDGIKVAEKDATMALTIKITSGTLTIDEWKDLIRVGLERATDGNSYVFEEQIRDFLGLMPNKINRFDIFKIMYKKGGTIYLYKNRTLLGTVKSIEFKKAFFKIWFGENPVDEELKEDLLGGTLNTNLVLGKWKTFDKRTGVAINIVQIYMLDKMVYGAIERMLRNSERDDVCYECQGEDKNQKVEGLVILKRLKSKGENKYIGGKYTNIKDGKISDCQIWVEEDKPDVLKVKYRGGGVQEWKRVKK
ncbi:chalcone isomerase family protein [Aquimarina sp. MMG016]|uniref:chalcone isomerase family protein n=1 Tax=Aquimarina sp. MMG016 TaxID=2822690 RepID=UPI001B3A5E6B|nr:chalcone isomerase family protein [Aquimarina sp. MMG016]MBQ4818451.1 chalcone isomerase family protein [Aquimarina sp. MMG016]